MLASRTLLLLLCLAVFAAPTSADIFTLQIPNEDWNISFDAPPLQSPKEAKSPVGYAFKAAADRFSISVFVEKPSGNGTSHKDCYEFYWPNARRNPMIAKKTIAVTQGERFVRVQYDIEAEFQGRKIRQRNVNYFFAYREKWIDVHISIIEPTTEDQKVFDTFDQSLAYSLNKPAA